MKKYITPATTVISTEAEQIMAVSQMHFDSNAETGDNFVREEQNPWSTSFDTEW